MADIDPSNAVVVQLPRTEAQRTADANINTIRQAALDALANNRAFIASTPTAGQSSAYIKQMARQQNALIRLLLGQLEGTD